MIAVFLLGLVGVLFPVIYLYTASKLPQLESEFDLESHFRNSVEGERISLQAALSEKAPRPVKFERPDFSTFPKDLVALYISEMGCPTFFESPREEGPRWGWRLFTGMVTGAMPEGDGACERYLALRLVWGMGIREQLDRTVAANKLRAVLQKDELVAYDLDTMRFERGVVGVRDAAWSLYKKELKNLDLAELAELMLALPIHGYYSQVKECRNASIIKQNRDHILRSLARRGLVSKDRAEQATAAPVACLN